MSKKSKKKKQNQPSTPTLSQNQPADPTQKEEKSVIGRPPEYEKKVLPRLKEIEYWGLIGYTNIEMANALDIAESTFYEYKKEYQEFSESVDKNKPLSNAVIAESLYNRARNQVVDEFEETVKDLFIKDKSTGLEVPVLDDYGRPISQRITKKIKKVIPGDVNAMKFWLSNRDKKNWQIKEAGNTDININSNNKNSNNTQNNQVNNTQFNYMTTEQRTQAYDKYKQMFVKNHDQYKLITPAGQPEQSI